MDGIRGRINMVADIRSGEMRPGRFGFKASQPTVEQQTAVAFFGDMNLANSLFKRARDNIVIDDDTLDRVSIYLELAGVPRARNQSDPNIVAGRILFQGIGCTDCHVQSFVTASSAKYPELENQIVRPYSDLLLHDMGRGLADRLR